MPNFVLQSYLHDASVASPPQVLFSRFHIFVGSLLQLQHLLLDVKAERDRALGLVAGLGVVAAEGNETQTARMSTSARRDCSPSRQVRVTYLECFLTWLKSLFLTSPSNLSHTNLMIRGMIISISRFCRAYYLHWPTNKGKK